MNFMTRMKSPYKEVVVGLLALPLLPILIPVGFLYMFGADALKWYEEWKDGKK